MVAFTTVLAASAAFELAVAAPSWKKPSKYHGHRAKNESILVELGPRPYYLVDDMEDSPLKEKLDSCKNQPKSTSSFSISHRGAPLEFPEHSRSGYHAAARMGAGTRRIL